MQFLDADDWLFPTKIESHMEVAHRLPSDVATFSAGEHEGEDGRISVHRCSRSMEDSVDFALEYFIQTNSILHPRVRLERVGGFDVNRSC